MMTLTKPTRIRSREVIQQIRKESEHRCEYMDATTQERCNHPAEGEPHHIRTRGAGGEDRRENLIHLCGWHHRLFHDGNLDRNELIQIVAKREGVAPEEIADVLKLPYQPPPTQPAPQPKIEELLQAYIQIDEQEQETRFIKGQLLDAMLAAGAKQKFLSSQIGVSPAQIRELVHVYRTFPTPESRVPTLSWYHHRVASHSSEPAVLLAKANDEAMSTRDLRKVILEQEGAEVVVKQEENVEQKQASRVLTSVQKILDSGSEAAKWLRAELKQILEEEQT
ncbi:hypothetical protein UY286_05200 [Paenibacillus polymyxa]|uniref:hypothetical protein n=1 Tax=Paenibacillus polymyxa TaxID=1406 RepID=UPI002AB46671|nr:hypothetical protein [Paenibacillus polymyxa]MDY7989808.1 hypothetical protein [Paenibacillus polymyxa]MDY8116833.1 hypothetical protein [Paenibacillus polymyxa]